MIHESKFSDTLDLTKLQHFVDFFYVKHSVNVGAKVCYQTSYCNIIISIQKINSEDIKLCKYTAIRTKLFYYFSKSSWLIRTKTFTNGYAHI